MWSFPSRGELFSLILAPVLIPLSKLTPTPLNQVT